ncbi:N-acetylmuramoyl-L-alanine amidase [Leptospira interrogans serovar Manilae]|uniref:N-acetylmuramoyl-L-alanine amidase n=1 Tax=Leptospira interrogans serovar Manilae TaxID=214675 RepID=A0AAQ1NWZ3_LEPIR|nr:peptidoglycan recognition family protein [Leptospira interrogans]AKP27239.1 N-acetylmuramoyl-L-alanine amidase [Leptospira interrogans serovar Manilae]AKP31010.1 N-acetylmuramoyl-L-alanine amidase [Leptospira interrogans serovar Manilae]EMJ52462.1 N-acetylmuramoyl-L-alanine amidase [Leptospira interrogans serovar Valbuzzi str. Duyster]ENO73164.1 N-acetylmuramoyl-L-alanine amidase [Leptospira interrogans serovar Valbuzzi str. Valbuzzi]EYU64864.1 N-acetylmuramoyl-L-alanine amidase [Leptospira
MKNNFFFKLAIFTLILNCSFPTKESEILSSNQVLPFFTLGIGKDSLKSIGKKRWFFGVKSILLHHTYGLKAGEYLDKSKSSGWMVHFIVLENGSVYGVEEPSKILYKAAPGMDETTIHVSWEGNNDSILKNEVQLKSLVNLIETLSKKHSIPLNNYDITSKKGIFTHTQSKKKFGRFLDTGECGSEKVLSSVLLKLQGNFFSETEWKDRFDSGWVIRKEKFTDPSGKKIVPTYNRGRGTTFAPIIELNSVEKTSDGKAPEEKRLRYNQRGSISPDCIVLHFTAIPDYQKTLEVLEKRNLSATFLADQDGKVYQLLDSILDAAAAAAGTNSNCFQVEIVGKDTEMLLANQEQTKAVVRLVKELSEKYKIPLNNERIESLRGVYSHTQAKKKWGGSIYLDGKDFDPGEPYMKEVLEQAGGTYYPEENWFDRQSENWILLFTDFQP